MKLDSIVESEGKNLNNKGKIFKIIYLIVLFSLGITIFFPPFLNGLFFETSTNSVEILVLLTFILFIIYKIGVKEKIFLSTSIEWAFLVIGFAYFISIFSSIQKRTSLAEWVKYIMCFAILLMLADVLKSNIYRKVTLWVIAIPAVLVCLIAYDGISGSIVVDFINKFFASLGVNFRFADLSEYGRIGSTFQYPNAFAGYLLGIIFILLGITMTSNKVIERMLGGACLFIVSTTFILTVSRGAYLVLVLSIILFLLILPMRSRINAILNLMSLVAICSLILIPIYQNIFSQNISEIKLMLFILGGLILTAVLFQLSGMLADVLAKINKKVYIVSSVLLLTILIVASTVLFTAKIPLKLSQDIENNSVKSLTRTVYLEPGKEYELVYDVESYADNENKNPYTIIIRSLNEKEILFGGSSVINTYSGMPSNGIETRKVIFSVPSDSKKVEIDFVNNYQGTSATFYSASINSAWSGKHVKNIVLKYKYMPDFIVSRLNEINIKNYDDYRKFYLKDGFKILKDYWFLGAGGGAWALLYQRYQSFDYISRYAHNYYLEIAIDTGILGIVGIVLLIISLMCHLLKNYKLSRKGKHEESIIGISLLTGIVAILLHSAIDFDYAMGAILLLICEMAGVYSAAYRQYKFEFKYVGNEETAKSKKYKNIFIEKLPFSFEMFKKNIAGALNTKNKISTVMSNVIILVITICILFFPLSFGLAKGFSKRAADALQHGNDYYKALSYVETASKIDFLNPIHRLDLINLKLQGNVTNENIGEIRGIVYDFGLMVKNNPILLPIAANYHIMVGNIGEGLRMAAMSTDMIPFDPLQWQTRAEAYYKSIVMLAEQYDFENMFSFIDDMLMMSYELQEYNKRNLRPVLFNKETYEMLEHMQYVSDNRNDLFEIELNKIAFYSVSYMDVDNNKIPDQWTVTGKGISLNIYEQDPKTIAVSYKKGQEEQYITSRELSLKPGKTYSIEINMGVNDPDKYINYMITGLMNEYGIIAFNGINRYVAEFSVPEDAQGNAKYALRLKFNESVNLRSILIIEK